MECTEILPTTPLAPPESSIPSDCWIIHVDDSAAESNCGTSLATTSPKGSKIFYALKYTFPIRNNESEYEAVVAGLRVARTLHIQKLHVFTDSQVIASQINGKFEAKEDNMEKYLQLVSSFIKDFQFLKIEHITRKSNTEADALSKLHSGDTLDGTWIEPLTQRSIDTLPILTITQEPSWMTPIIQYISADMWPPDRAKHNNSKILQLDTLF